MTSRRRNIKFVLLILPLQAIVAVILSFKYSKPSISDDALFFDPASITPWSTDGTDSVASFVDLLGENATITTKTAQDGMIFNHDDHQVNKYETFSTKSSTNETQITSHGISNRTDIRQASNYESDFMKEDTNRTKIRSGHIFNHTDNSFQVRNHVTLSSRNVTNTTKEASTGIPIDKINLPTGNYGDQKYTYSHLPPIEELVETGSYSCPDGLYKINNTHLPRSITHTGRRIPKVIHLTAKSRCMPLYVLKHLEKWRFEGHSFYFHDDFAVDRLLHEVQHAPNNQEFVPNMTKVLSCVTSGATKSDLWRYMVLWHYGGKEHTERSRIFFSGVF